MDDVELDNERHKREEQERRAKRKAHRSSKSKSESQAEKERKRKEHAQRILGAQQPSKKPTKKPPTPPTHRPPPQSQSSVFQSLFQQRAQGFLIDFHFRNAPPRPPVGPNFIGLGLEGELSQQWTKYKARNAVEKLHVWKLHLGEKELYSRPLAISALDWEGGCYCDVEKGGAGGMEESFESQQLQQQQQQQHVIPPLHPEDEALIHWKGSLGDTAAEQLQQRRDRARAAARLAIAQGYGSLASAKAAASLTTPGSKFGMIGGGNNKTTALTTAPTTTGATTLLSSGGGSSSGMKLKKKHHLQSRILDEKTPNFMKKTTYLTNDATSVHRFTSLAVSQEKRAREVDRALAETTLRYKREDVIERGFREANSWDVKGIVVAREEVGETSAAAAGNTNKKRRVHPSKKGVYPVWDLPLLPDVPTWGHTYAHVVLDHPPKSIGHAAATPTNNSGGMTTTTPTSKNRGGGGNLVSAQQLQKAIVADVTKQTQNSRMACTVWVPETSSTPASDSESPKEEGVRGGEEEEEPTRKKAKKEVGKEYRAVQRYDLDVLPLRDPSGPQVHYVWIVDPSKKYVGYHPVGSRVQLSMGRPIVQAGGSITTPRGARTTPTDELATNESIIFRRIMEVDERKDMEKRMAEVDVDMAEKYGLVEDEDLEEENGGGEKKEGSGSEAKKTSSDSDAEMEEEKGDAF